MNLQLKVCGMRDSQNIADLMQLSINFMGFIFYDKSPRNAGNNLDVDLLLSFPKIIKKVGVFVDAETEFITNKVNEYKLDFLQLHGHENPYYCQSLHKLGFKIIKAFSINESFDFSTLEAYNPYCEYFLFDTKGKNLGGNGLKFDWTLLNQYKLTKPFFLSGGIELSDMSEVTKLKEKHGSFFAIDVNSKFEISPGLKDVAKVKKLIQILA
jgi:phosphoribosylanthranilate isomerase